MSWMNADGLYVKMAKEEADVAPGGQINFPNGSHAIEFEVSWSDLLSATDSILGSVGSAGTNGVIVPKGARIEAVEVLVKTAFTSSGTIGSSTMLLGLIKTEDRTTELDYNGFLTASFVGSRLDAAGERTYVEVGSTGAGALIGTTTAEEGVVSVSNSQHSSHPYTAGLARVRIIYYRV